MGTAELHAEIDRLTAGDLPRDPAVLGPRVLEIDRAIRRLQAEKSRTVGEFDLVSGCETDSQTTTKAWLRIKTKTSPADAAGQQAIARIHGELPLLFAAWHAGRTSYDHVRHVEINLRRLPAELWEQVDPTIAEKAVAWPVKEFGQWLRELADSLGPDPKPKDETQRQARRLSLTLGFNGMTNVHGQLHPEVAEKFHAALSAASRPDATGEIRSKGQRNADALEDMLDTLLNSAALPVDGGERPHLNVSFDLNQLDEATQREHERLRVSAADWYQLIRRAARARVAAALTQADAATDPATGRPHYYWTGPATSTAIRRLACDGIVLPIYTRGDTPIDVGRATRVINNPLRRFIIARDRHCRWPDCTMPARWTQIHHVVHWKDGGTTDRDNLLLLCDHHHHAAHDGRWTLVLHAPGHITVRRRTRHDQPYYEIRLKAPPTKQPVTLDQKLHDAARRIAGRT